MNKSPEIPKCKHGVYNGTKPGLSSDYCTGCNYIQVGILTEEEKRSMGKLEIEWNKRINIEK